MSEIHKAWSILENRSFSEDSTHVIVEGIASTPTPDRVGDSVDPMGAVFKTPMSFLLYHDTRLPVGNVVFAQPTKKGIPFRAQIPKVLEEGVVRDRVNEAIHSLKYNLINAVSIGFKALDGAVESLKGGGLRFLKWEWVELSLVSVPANSEAVITAIKSFDLSGSASVGKAAGEPASARAERKTGPVRLQGHIKRKPQFIRILSE